MPTTIVAIYEHRCGDDIRSFVSTEAAEAWRQSLAQEFWETEMDRPMPEAATPKEIADLYFDFAQEYFVVRDLEVDDGFTALPRGRASGPINLVMTAFSFALVVAVVAVSLFGGFK